MNIKKISVKIIVLYSLMMAMFLSPLMIINRASVASVLAVIVIVGCYIAGELYLWKREMDEEKKELLHLGTINIALSVTFLIFVIVFWMYGYGAKGVMPSILFIVVYCLTGIIFTMLFLKRANTNRGKRKRSASIVLGPIAGAVIGIGGAKLFLKDASQSTMIFILISGGYILAIIGLLVALSFFCKYMIKKKDTLND